MILTSSVLRSALLAKSTVTGRSVLLQHSPAALANAVSSSSSSSTWWTSTSTGGATRTMATIKTHFQLPDPSSVRGSLPLSKIVATIGPTSEQEGPLKQVVEAGMTVMRLNFSHATVEEVELRCTNLAKAQEAIASLGSKERQDVRAILLDTKGPEIRSGKLAHDESGHETVKLTAGNTVYLHTDPSWKEQGDEENLFIDYPGLRKCMQPGMKVLLDDGAVVLTVKSLGGPNGAALTCQIENSGEIRSRAGVNLPLADTSDLPALSPKDKNDIKYGMTKDIDFVAASFVQNAEGVREIRAHIQQCAKELGWPESQPLPLIISKIESASALKHFDAILQESDGIMVARGDLGVEIPLQQVTNAQKEMVAACNAAGKPVVVATQMLESMSKNPRPTRAEVADVTNAVYDGADAVMLSGETAKGKYPSETVQFMNEIIQCAEQCQFALKASGPFQADKFLDSPKTPDAAIAKAAVTAAHERGSAAILVLTNHGTLPALVSAYRPNTPIFAFCPSAKLGRRLQLYRGVYPIVGLQGVSAAKRPEHAVEEAKQMGYLKTDDEVIVVAMDDNGMGRTATMKIATVP